MRIDCSTCAMYQSSHCDDCLVTALLHPGEGPVDLDDETAGSLDALSSAGLIPVLRFRPRGSPADDASVGSGDEPAEGNADHRLRGTA